MADRKLDHINLAFESQIDSIKNDRRFYYEPLLSGSPKDEAKNFHFMGKKLAAPIWVSSMTGGTELAGKINRNLAKACNRFGLGMGLGSCRKLMKGKEFWDDFNLRPLIGSQLPFFANLGIAQVEELVEKKEVGKIIGLVNDLEADGLIIHVNPTQEWFQPEGDVIHALPIETISKLLHEVEFPVIVKEVGQGIGPASLKKLLKIPLAAIEFGAFGGTNFSKVEMMRHNDEHIKQYEPLTFIGHTASEMVNFINDIVGSGEDIHCKQVIISGGIRNFLDGYYLVSKCKLPALYGQASAFLQHARNSYEELEYFIESQIKGYRFAESFLKTR